MNQLSHYAVTDSAPVTAGPQPGHGLGHVADDWAAIEVWLKASRAMATTVASKQVNTYRYHLAKLRWYCEQYLGRTPSAWSAQDAEAFADYLAELPSTSICVKGVSAGRPGYAPFQKAPSRTAQSDILRFTKAMFTALHGTGYLRLNPMTLMKVAKQRRIDKRRAVDGDLFDLVLQVMTEMPRSTQLQHQMYWRDRFIFICLRESGLRASELVGGRMTALRPLYDAKSGNTYWVMAVDASTAKGGHERTVPVTPALLDALIAYRAAFGLDPLPGRDTKDYGLVLSVRTKKREVDSGRINASGRRLLGEWRDVGTCFGLHAIVKGRVRDAVELLKQAGDDATAEHLERVSSHWLRHTFAMIQLLNGQDIRTVATSLGHRSVETTMVYTEQDALDQIRNWESENPGSVARVARTLNEARNSSVPSRV